jgi:putative ABC transport system permease protein
VRIALSLLKPFIIRDLSRNWIRTVLTISGIALGVAVMLAINLANNTALSRFRESIDIVAGKSNLQVHSRVGLHMDETVITDLKWLWDSHTQFSPLIDELAVFPGKTAEMVQVLGIDMFGKQSFRPFNLSGNNSAGEFEIFKIGRVYVGEKFAARHNLKLGDNFQLLINDRQRDLKVAGVLTFEGIGKAFGGNLLVTDVSTAQELFDMPGRITRLDIIAPDDAVNVVRDELAEKLPPALVVERPERRGEQVEKMISAFQYNLLALSLIALLAGMFVIYNTMSMTVIRRRPEVGTLRAIGVSRKTILALFTCEALILGVVGSVLGAALGVFFAGGAVAAVARTVQALYVDQPPAEVTFNAGILAIAMAAGIGLTLLASLGPVLEAFSVSAAEASRRATYEFRVIRFSWGLAITGVLLMVLAALCSFAPAVNGFPVFGYASAAFIIFGAALCMPVVLGTLISKTTPTLYRVFGAEGKLAGLSLYGTLGRTSVTVASLMVGIAMMVSLAVMIGSFRQTVIVWVNQTLKADLYLEPAVRSVSNRTGRLSPDVVNKIRANPSVEAVDAFVDFPIEYEGQLTNFGAGELPVLAEHGALMFVSGEPTKVVLERVNGKKACVVTESFAERFKVKVGDMVPLPTPQGLTDFRVEGIYYDYVSDLGYVVIPLDVYRDLFKDETLTTLGIYTKPNTDADAVRNSIFTAAGTQSRLNIRTNRELKQEVLRIFDNTFAITYALHTIAIIVAILGVTNALFSLTMELRRELAILKYLGAVHSQLRKIILIQAGLLGLLGNLGGLAVGLALSFLLIHVINKQSFGWTIQFALPVDFLLQSFILIFISSLVAGLLPARMATRTLTSEAVRAE